MTRLRIVLIVSLGMALYWSSAIWVLFHAFTVMDDGYGREVSFYWGKHPPNAYPQIAYAYIVAASLLTLLACGTIWSLRRVQTGPLQTFLLAWVAAFFAFCFAVVVSDAGAAYHIWNGPTAFATDRTAAAYPRFLYIIIRMSFLAGILAVTLKKARSYFLFRAPSNKLGA